MKVELVVQSSGHQGSKVLLDGVDVTRHVTAVAFSASVGDVTTVRLDLLDVDVSAEGEAFVEGVVIPIIPTVSEPSIDEDIA